MIDYKKLLVVYIKHIGENEGISYLTKHRIETSFEHYNSLKTLTPEELKELRALDGEDDDDD